MFNKLKHIESDINEHLETLKNLAEECDHITEMGVRSIVSTWAFAEGLKSGARLVAIDIKHPNDYGGDLAAFTKFCNEKGINFEFILGDTTKIEIQETDLLFIDTLHTYEQLKKEFILHADKARKYIALHDTVSCAHELIPAIDELVKDGVWSIHMKFDNNNGLMVLKR